MFQSLLADLKLFSLLIVISAGLLFLDNIGAMSFPKQAVTYISSPIQYGLYKSSLTVSDQFTFVAFSRKSLQENKALKEQLAQILSENTQLRKKIAEQQAFLDQNQALDTKTFSLVAARPVGVSRSLFLDKGSDANFKVNDAVVFKDNFIGQIIRVSPKKSEVRLSSDPDSKIAAFSSNTKGKAKGLLVGQFGSEMLLDKILHDEPVEKNDLVYSDGTETTIPRGLVLGQVTEVIDKDNEVFKQAKVKPIFNIADIDVVFVITN